MASSTRDLNMRFMVLIAALSVIFFGAIFIGFEAVFRWVENWKNEQAMETAVPVDRILTELEQEAVLRQDTTVEINGKSVRRAPIELAIQKLIADQGGVPAGAPAAARPAATPDGGGEPQAQPTPRADPQTPTNPFQLPPAAD
ncbi:MAG: hypothetical protein AAF612_12765 [Planctomycetota bacterium]